MPHANQHYLKLKQRTKIRNGLDALALDEYTVGGLTVTRFLHPNETNPARPKGNEYYGCQLTTAAIPMGMRRIGYTELYPSSGTSSPYGPQLATPEDPLAPIYLTVVHNIDPNSTVNHPNPDAPVQACDYCSDGPQGLIGIETPCARSLMEGTSDEDHLFVEWNWVQGYLYEAGASTGPHKLTETGVALFHIFKSLDPVKLVATVTPNHTVVWVPFSRLQADPRATKWTNLFTINLPDVVYMDKPGIWLERRLRFTL